MSIWSSVHQDDSVLDRVPSRDNYSGSPDGGDGMMVDVATPSGYHDLVRLTVGFTSVLLSPAEVRCLLADLLKAQDIIATEERL